MSIILVHLVSNWIPKDVQFLIRLGNILYLFGFTNLQIYVLISCLGLNKSRLFSVHVLELLLLNGIHFQCYRWIREKPVVLTE